METVMFLFTAALGWQIGSTEPCDKYKTISGQYRRSPGYQKSNQETSVCDRFNEDWFRINSSTGSDMTRSCPPVGRCGAVFPVWMTEPFPATGSEATNITVCRRSLFECCQKQWTILVKNCGTYRVYRLKPADVCPAAYCFGDLPRSSNTTDNFTIATSKTSAAATIGSSVTSTEDISKESSTKSISLPQSLPGISSTPRVPEVFATTSVPVGEDSKLVIILSALVGTLVVILLSIAVIFFCRLRKRRETSSSIKNGPVIDEHIYDCVQEGNTWKHEYSSFKHYETINDDTNQTTDTDAKTSSTREEYRDTAHVNDACLTTAYNTEIIGSCLTRYIDSKNNSSRGDHRNIKWDDYNIVLTDTTALNTSYVKVDHDIEKDNDAFATTTCNSAKKIDLGASEDNDVYLTPCSTEAKDTPQNKGDLDADIGEVLYLTAIHNDSKKI